MKNTKALKLLAMTVILVFAFSSIIGTLSVSADTGNAASNAADTAADGTSNDNGTDAPNPASTLIYYAVLIGGFGLLAYFFIIRPDKKRKKEAQELRNSLAVGDKVVTIGGIIGTIVQVKDDTIVLDNGLSFQLWAIRSSQKPELEDVDDYDDDDDDDDDE